MTSWRIIQGDCVEAMRAMREASVDAIVTDPPYDLTAGKRGGNGAGGFMGKAWDGTGVAFDPATWREALRVLKPGGHLLAFGGTRTYHRLTCAIEDAGFEVRDCLAWLYGSGFPKSLDVSKAIDKAAGAERGIVGRKSDPRYASPATAASGSPLGNISPRVNAPANYERAGNLTAPATPEAGRWQGWGTALKPAYEPIVLARKPLIGTVAGNVLAHGTGALNVDGCRIGGAWENPSTGLGAGRSGANADGAAYGAGLGGIVADPHPAGRWPANAVLDPEAAALLDAQTGELHSQDPATRNSGRKPGWSPSGGARPMLEKSNPNGGDTGGASRFFYVAKADTAERNTGLHGQRNPHPTVKPVALMRWLCRLVTPPGGLVLDPFTGSGTTGIAALREGFAFIGIEREAEYVAVARARIIGDAPLINGAAELAA